MKLLHIFKAGYFSASKSLILMINQFKYIDVHVDIRNENFMIYTQMISPGINS